MHSLEVSIFLLITDRKVAKTLEGINSMENSMLIYL